MPILEDLQDRLSEHFHELRNQLVGDVSLRPIFVLEHGLGLDELEVLKTEVRSYVARRRIKTHPWLPLIVYATEIGYGYSGDEYWQTFEEETPGWEYEDGYLLRQRFIKFVEQFGGTTPTGPWAEQFSLICWPITHAVLPTDLQRQLARLLYENRYELTKHLLDNPDELGGKLAARAWHSSSRFQKFAQNTDLLGQVAVALLTGEDEESPYLSSSTLHRIVTDLNREREARSWLRDAKRRAISVRTRGFLPAAVPTDATSRNLDRRRFPASTDPGLTVRRMADGWVAFMQLPDLSPLAERLPALYSELRRLRCRVSGVNGPLATGKILYGGQSVRLDSWPAPSTPLFEIEGGSEQGRSLLLDQSVLTSDPWLFRLVGDSTGTEVRGRLVRPGGRYLLITRAPFSEGVPNWIAPTKLLTEGVYAYLLEIPISLDTDSTEYLQKMNLGCITDVEIRPAGLVPAGWDGEGRAEWIVDEEPIVAIRSTKVGSRLLLTVDGDPSVIAWPPGETEIFLRLSRLEPGAHEFQVALLGEEDAAPIAEGRVSIFLRQPQQQTGIGSPREGLSVMTYPPGSGLAELWEGRSSLEVLGPTHAKVKVRCALTARRSNELLVERTFSAQLPLSPTTWPKIFTPNFRNVERVQRFYDEAESCYLAFSHPDLGERSVVCEREFEPIRWALGKDRDGPFAKLIDNTESGNLVVHLFSFESPGDPMTLESQTGLTFRNAEGGLIRAEANDLAASAILPPDVHDIADLQRTAKPSRPRLRSQTAAGLKQLVEVASLWSDARLPSNPLAAQQQRKVLQAIVVEIACAFGGNYWAAIERKASRTDALTRRELIEAVGRQPWQRTTGSAVFDIAARLIDSPAESRASAFAAALRDIGQPSLRHLTTRQGELMLRLLSEPGSLAGIPSDDIQSVIELLLQAPVALRAARLLILAVHNTETEDSGSCYRGWPWS